MCKYSRVLLRKETVLRHCSAAVVVGSLTMRCSDLSNCEQQKMFSKDLETLKVNVGQLKANQTVQRTEASPFAQGQIQRPPRLAPVADLCVRRIMATRPFISVAGFLLAFACGCQSLSPEMQPAGAQPPAAVTAQPVISPGFTWSIPPDFPTFGTTTTDSIRVAIFGYSIKKRGYHYLSRGATVHDAMQAAQFSGFVWWKRPYCGIQRQRPDGSVDTIWFTQASRAADEQRVLQNDDRLKISHEVY